MAERFLCRSNCSTIFSSAVSRSFDTLDRSDTVFFFFLFLFAFLLRTSTKGNSRTYFDHVEFPKENVVVSENSFGKSFVADFTRPSLRPFHMFSRGSFSFLFPSSRPSFPRMTVNDASLSALVHIPTLMAKCT